MRKPKKYRVLIVDDKKEALDTDETSINTTYHSSDSVWNIEINTVHINVVNQDNQDNQDNQYHIDENSINQLAQLAENPFDLLLLDFGYRTVDVDYIYSLMKDGFSLEIFEKHILNPKRLTEEGNKLLSTQKVYNSFYKNFVKHKGNIIVYTYNSEKDRKIFPKISTYCYKVVKAAFTHAANITVIDTRKEIFNGTKFESIKSENEPYYYFILAKYKEQLIRIEIAKKEISIAKYIKIKKTTKIIGLITLFGLLIGAGSEFFGSLIVDLFKNNQTLIASIILIFTLIIILFGGKLLLWLIERSMKNLLMIDD
jgi:hypothetical protein